MHLNTINNFNKDESIDFYWNTLKSNSNDCRYNLGFILGKNKISQNELCSGIQYLDTKPLTHLKFSKMGIIARHLNETNIFNNTNINDIYEFYLDKYQNNINFITGYQNFWEIISLLKNLKKYNPDKIRSICEIISYSYGYFQKIDILKITSIVYKVLEFSKYC